MKTKIVAFGEIMLRLTPPDKNTVAASRSFDACYGGTESNVLVALSCLGDCTDYLTAVSDNALGEAVIRHLRSFGVGTDNIIVQGDTLGMYFLEEGFGPRGAKVIYNRRHSEVSKLDENAFDYDRIFDGCTLFHISGISFALSDSSRALALRLLKEAKERGICTSFDFNYRATLWSIEEAAEVYKKAAPFIDIMFCSSRDLTAFLDTTVEGFHRNFPCEYLVVREREIGAGGEQKAYASIYRKGFDAVSIAPSVFTPLERIGSGDAFTAGVLHILSNDKDATEKALEFGMACFVLKHTLKGDVFTLNENSINAYISNRSKDVIR